MSLLYVLLELSRSLERIKDFPDDDRKVDLTWHITAPWTAPVGGVVGLVLGGALGLFASLYIRSCI